MPIESLFAEMMARPGFAEKLQHDYRVMLAGPTNFLALLNSLQMGFRTLAIEKRTNEVWTLLGAVKTEFGKFGDVLAKTKERHRQGERGARPRRGAQPRHHPRAAQGRGAARSGDGAPAGRGARRRSTSTATARGDAPGPDDADAAPD